MNTRNTAYNAVPLDVRWMNRASTALFALAAFAGVAALVWWAMQLPLFKINHIAVSGDTSRNSALTLRANVPAKLMGTFYTLNLRLARDAFEAMPWVRRADVRRVFPDGLKVVLQEHQPVALWGSETEPRLINSYGEVFEANVGDVDQDSLPLLLGPDERSAEILAMYQALSGPLAELDTELVRLELSQRGGWRAELDGGTLLELGSGSAAEILTRTRRYVRTIPQITSRYGRDVDAVLAVDLRYPEGYALRLRGVATVMPESSK
jgi:cell division protein FtsQ